MKRSHSLEPKLQQTRHSAVSVNSAVGIQAFADDRESTTALRQLKAAMASSPQAAVQRKISQLMNNNNPRLLAERKMLSGEPVQRIEEEELLQKKSEPLQRVEEEELQKKAATDSPAQLKEQSSGKPNNTGLPDNLKSGIESLSGMSMDSARVHYNSSQPAQLNALAYAQGTDIHIAPGQEQHLPHEAWHVVQQAQGRVQPTVQMKDDISVNNNKKLGHEADFMGEKAISVQSIDNTENAHKSQKSISPAFLNPNTVQRKTGFEMELHVPVYGTPPDVRKPRILKEDTALSGGERLEIKTFLGGGLEYGLDYGHESGDLFDITADHGAYQTPHRELITALSNNGYINSDFLYRSMTNIEYRTPPLEERKEGATARLKAIAAALKAHASDTATKSKLTSVQDLNAPALDLHTGVPTVALNKMVSGASVDVKSKVTTAQNSIDPFVYFQTNTGVLPSEIPELFSKASADIWLKNAFEETPQTVAAQLMLDESIKIASVLVKEAEPILKDMNSMDIGYFLGVIPAGDLMSLKGWMALIAQYLFGYQLEKSNFLNQGSTGKNLVAYMAKTPIPTSLQALPSHIRPFIDASAIGKRWEALFAKLVTEAAKIDIVTAAKLTASAVTPSKVIGGDALAWIKAILSGGKPYTVQSGRPLDLDKEQEKLSPKLSVQGEQAIVLEDRYSALKLSNADLKDMSKIDTLIEAEWAAAVKRRSQSTVSKEDISAKAESAAAKFDWLKTTTDKWLSVAEKKFNVTDPTLSGWKSRLQANSPLLVFDSSEYQTYNANLAALKKDIINHVDQLQKALNDRRHEWLTEITYRDIEYKWKDINNNEPTLHADGDVWVKMDGKWKEAVIKTGYFQYQDKSNQWKKIERNISGARTYYSSAKTWIP
ncbi:DUF4157 domain-containing protein [Nitrosomonas sp.]|uniref:eCIS core domain-containing protein n=1 Tax=Nitrosomonas sp. TaxID=42353 RepID=UPI0025F783DB|nr:DUF4157 domain-containing protein [Nitrosomonas sp.]MBV6447650.1 hypothetical protein [Nitrosomonas sp.]